MSFKEMIENIDMTDWKAPTVGEDIPHGDMPGDKVEIGEDHIKKANLIFPVLMEKVKEASKTNKTGKVVVAVCGGSGVGKSETASLLSYYFNDLGIKCYTLSGDNYPRRIPKYNDAERLRIFREAGLKQLIDDCEYTKEHFEIINKFQNEEMDADWEKTKDYPWMSSYIKGGVKGLKGYLGTSNETNFEMVENILREFKDGFDKVWLKRMGRTETQLWFEEMDFSETGVIIVEWTHGNSDCFKGVDVPVLLNSTPEETLAHRRARNRDGKTDSPFTMRVLEVEQGLLHSQAKKAKIIVSKAGELLNFEEYKKLMGE